MFETHLEIQTDKLGTEKLNLNVTHSLVKNQPKVVIINLEKKGNTSNVLIMTDGNGIPIGIGQF